MADSAWMCLEPFTLYDEIGFAWAKLILDWGLWCTFSVSRVHQWRNSFKAQCHFPILFFSIEMSAWSKGISGLMDARRPWNMIYQMSNVSSDEVSTRCNFDCSSCFLLVNAPEEPYSSCWLTMWVTSWCNSSNLIFHMLWGVISDLLQFFQQKQWV